MVSIRPYLLEAFYQWIVDSQCTPILLVEASQPQCRIPQEFLEDGEAVFNISPHAIRDLKISKEHVSFKASFSGVIHVISVPLTSVLALYAEENGDGYFPEEENTLFSSATASIAQVAQVDIEAATVVKKTKPFLKLVENKDFINQ